MTQTHLGIGARGGAPRAGILAPDLVTRIRRPGVMITLGPAALAWMALCAMPFVHLDLQLCAVQPARAAAAFRQALDLQWIGFRPGLAALEWALMITAMMLPLIGAELEHLRARVFARDRGAVMGTFLFGYLGAWLLAGIAAIAVGLLAKALLQTAGPVLDTPLLPIALAALWLISRRRKAFVYRCHYRPVLVAGGPQARIGAFVQGIGNARYCIASCLPLMVAMQIAGGGLWGMALLACVLVTERRVPRSDPYDAAILLFVFGIYLTLI